MTQALLPITSSPDAQEILWSDEPEMESSLHYAQLLLLVTCLEWYWREQNDYFIGADLTIYYSPDKIKNRDFRGPDFFVVKEVSKEPRPSWVVWQEGDRYPNVIIELLSKSTEKVDKTTKKELYQTVFQTPEYFWFSPDTLEFMGYRLINGQYSELPLTASQKRWSEELQLYLGVKDRQLRYFDMEEILVASPQEAALQAQERANRLADYLQSLGIDPAQISD